MNKKDLLKFVQELCTLKEKLKCPICLDVIQEVAELDCGHRYCEACHLEHKSTKKTALCPLCQTILKRRSTIFRDIYGSTLGKFVDKSCKCIRTFFHCEVEELRKKLNDEIQENCAILENVTNKNETATVLPSTSKVVKEKSTKKSDSSKENCEDAFDKLMNVGGASATVNKRGTKRVYTNKKKAEKKLDVDYNILEFDNYENKSAVLLWLNNTKNRFDRLTQTQTICNEEQHESQMLVELISVSQVKKKKTDSKPFVSKHTQRGRAKSLDIEIKKVVPHEKKRYFQGGGSDIENYDIEEINTEEEEIVKKAEEKVLLNLMEEEVLDKLDSEMQYKPNLEEKLEKAEQGSRVTSAAGWDRITKINKTIKKSNKKTPKQLNISLQSTQSAKNENKETGTLNLKSVEMEDTPLTPSSASAPKIEEVDRPHVDTDEKMPSYDLHKLEDYITNNMEFLEESPSSSTPVYSHKKNINKDIKKISQQGEDLETVKVVEPTEEKISHKEKEHHKDNKNTDFNDDALFNVPTQQFPVDRKKTNVVVVDDSNDVEALYFCPTQKTNHTCKVVIDDINGNCNSVPKLIDLLEETLEKCRKNIGIDSKDVLENLLLTMKYYISKLRSLSNVQSVEAIKDTPTTCDATTQINIETADKNVQIQVNNAGVKTQTDNTPCPKCSGNPSTNTTKLISQNTRKAITSMLGEAELNVESIQQSTNSNKPKRNEISKQPSENDIFTSTFDNLNFETQDIEKNQQVSLTKLQTDSRQLEAQNKKGGSSKRTTQLSSDSVLVCTTETIINPTNSKGNNQQLVCEADRSKRFKRIKVLSPDSDSDEEAQPPTKRVCKRFVRDDLSIEFQSNVEAVSVEKMDRGAALESSESENINYDEYLLQIMKKYDNYPSTSEKNKRTFGESQKDSYKDILTKEQVSKKAECPNETTLSSSPSKESFHTASPNVSNVNEEFIADKVFMDEHNLQKLEDAIQNYERDSTKTRNTEKSVAVIGEEELGLSRKRSEETISRDDNPQSASLFCGSENDVLHKDPAVDNLEEICMDLNDETQLENIKMRGNKSNINSKINVIDNVKIQSPYRNRIEEDDLFSDEDIVETTPQKKVASFAERSILTQISNIDNLPMSNDLLKPLTEAEHTDYDFSTLPPPAQFQDDIQELNNNPNEGVVIDLDSAITDMNMSLDILSQTIINRRTTKDHDVPQVLPSCNKDNEDEQSKLPLTPKILSSVDASQAQRRISHSTPMTQRSFTRVTLDFSPISADTSQRSNIIDIAHTTKYTPLSSVTKNPPQKQNIRASTPKQKSIWNYVKPSQDVGQTDSVVKSKPCVACTRLTKEQIKSVSQLTSKKLATYSSTYNSNVTHMIVAVDEKNCVKDYTIKFVFAVASGIWVLRYEWIEECLNKNCIVAEEPFEVPDKTGLPGPKISRLMGKTNPLLRGYKIYCADPFIAASRSEIENIIKLLGGKVVSHLNGLLEDDGNIRLIIGECNATQDFDQYEDWAESYKAVTVDIEWLSKCVGQYKMRSFRPYVWCSEDNLADFGYPSFLTEAVPFSHTETF